MSRTICSGLTVLEFGSGMAGDLTTMILADNGARVLKVEPPGGDPLRRDLPSGFLVWNRGKESVVLDLDDPRGRQQARQLAQHADVLVEGFETGRMEGLALGYDEVHGLNPALVYCSIKGFGSKGAYAHLKVDHGIVAAKCGAFLDAGFRPGPMYIASPSTTSGAGQMAVQGILAALVARERTGRGQFLEATLYQGHSPADYFGMATYQMQLRDPKKYPARMQTGRGSIASNYCTKDGRWLIFTLQLPHQQVATMRACGLEWIYEDERFAHYPQFASEGDAEAFYEIMVTRIRERTLEEWLDIFLKDPDVPFEVLVTSEQGLEHPQVIHNKHWVVIDDPTVGKMRQVGPIAAFSETPSIIARPAPGLGEHDALPHANGRLPKDNGSKASLHPLDGVTIVECGYFYAMPFGVALTASLGARVIKIEPLEGDPMRWAFNFPEAGSEQTMQGKESLPLDMKAPEGQKVIHQLAAQADVFITSFRPGVPERLKVDYETLKKINPRLVYVHATGYGASGPYAHRPNYAGNASAVAGQVGRQAAYWIDPQQAEGLDVEGLKELSLRVKALVDGDSNGALGVATALLLGIYDQQRTGEGQFIVTTQINGNLYNYSDDFCSYEGKPPVAIPDPDYYGLNALYRLYRADGGWVFLSITSQAEWETFCAAVGQEGLSRDSRFSTTEARKGNDAALVEALTPMFAGKTAADWEQELLPKGAGCVRVFESATGSLVNWYSEFSCEDPVIREAGLVGEIDHPVFGRILRHGLPVQLSETPGKLSASCKLGQQTDALLTELGYGASQVAELKERRVVAGEFNYESG